MAVLVLVFSFGFVGPARAFEFIEDGEVGRDLYAGTGALEINGMVGGDVNAEVGDPDESMGAMRFFSFMPPGTPTMISPGLHISESAEIGGKLAHTSFANRSEGIEAAPGDGIVYSTPVPDVDASPNHIGPGAHVTNNLEIGRWLLQRARELMTLLALGALVLWLLPDLSNKVFDKAASEPLPSSGWGLVTVIAGYAGAAILAGLVLTIGIFFGVLTLGGLGRTIFGVGFSSLGLGMAVFVLLVTYGSKLAIAMWGGKWILEKTLPLFVSLRTKLAECGNLLAALAVRASGVRGFGHGRLLRCKKRSSQ